ncbi:uncharacterized protein PV09_03170 [Verruconis gallopava]|uniref:PWI domain-containing protein n=1 Tax=Verruconis gallopava TaxID=253628 RepID=A0A0D1XTF3_9PEZI|nr:uncharacterized protein PV09_03170 [Verruconis gallopava]KIW05986.1 hypothetical protein PV09_03170 [Verruconis gallopava]
MSYYGAPGSYGNIPPGYAGYPPQSSSPPGAAPGIGGGPPGGTIVPGQHPLPARPGGYPPNFQIPPNMPKFDMNASVIRLGTSGSQKGGDGISISGGPSSRGVGNDGMGGASRRAGLGMERNLEQQRQQIRESMQALLPPKTDEVLKTIFVGGITEGCGGDAGIESILRAAGSLRKWTRAIDADNKPCTFGFAEYEDSESLETAAEVLKDVYVPVKKQQPKKKDEEGNVENGDAEEEVERAKLLVVVDDASKEYAENWAQQRGDTEDDKRFRLDGAREALNNVLARLFNPIDDHEFEGAIAAQDNAAQTQDPITGEVITIPLAQTEDELSDIPAEMRETVAAEIAAFRERSNRRDLERLKREEEIESKDRYGGRAGSSSTVPTAPAGVNGVPVGPKGIQGAPSGPKGLRGVQIPKDYQNGVSFVSNSNELEKYLNSVDEDTDASDGELEKRRREKKIADEEKAYLDYERRWLNRERARAAALERERKKDENEARRAEESRASMARMLREWNDDVEARRKTSEYYADRVAWAKHRQVIRAREIQADDNDRREEENEKRAQQNAEAQARGMADEFLDRQAEELGAKGIGATKPAFKISLGAAAQKARQAAEAPKRKAAADVENLLDADEGSAGDANKRTLIPISFDTAAEAAALTDEERSEARRQLAFSIPHDKDGLFEWSIKWDSLASEIVEERLRPFVEKKSMEYLGMVEELMWDVVRSTLDKHEGPSRLMEELEGLLEDETEGFVKKLWRMVIFYSESEARGLGGDGVA